MIKGIKGKSKQKRKRPRRVSWSSVLFKDLEEQGDIRKREISSCLGTREKTHISRRKWPSVSNSAEAKSTSTEYHMLMGII